jgi:hypothetical protein
MTTSTSHGKRCPNCTEVKKLDDFTKCSRSKDGRHWWCKACTRYYMNRRNKDNPPKPDPHVRRKHNLKKKYGITIEQYDQMFDDQGGVCAICKNTQTKKRLAVDHCHDTGQVRGLLCDKCNRAIGLLGDTKERLEAALEYLREAQNGRIVQGLTAAGHDNHLHVAW